MTWSKNQYSIGGAGVLSTKARAVNLTGSWLSPNICFVRASRLSDGSIKALFLTQHSTTMNNLTQWAGQCWYIHSTFLVLSL